MKKLLSLLMILFLLVPVFTFTGCSTGDVIELKMYVPGEYIDEDTFEDFEQWYEEETGEKIKVITPTTFDTVEDVMTAIEHDHADFDLLCPSDYMVERLKNKGLLQKLDKDLILDLVKSFDEEYYEDVERYEDIFEEDYARLAAISEGHEDEITFDYSMPYMYGTFGIMYDYSKTDEHIYSWSAIFEKDYQGKSANKASLREAISSAALWNAYNSDSEYKNLVDNSPNSQELKAKVQSIFEDTSKEAIKGATDTIKKMTKYSAIWGGEDLKYNMATGTTQVQVALMWSCDAGYVMNDFEDDNGNEHEGNRDLWYRIPKEGGNVYNDCFVISKYAKNYKAANYFLAYLCKNETAIANSEMAGAVSCVKQVYEELKEEMMETLWPDEDDSDTTYALEEGDDEDEDEDDSPDYSDMSEEWKEMYFDMLFPSKETLNRCGIMRDYKDRDGDITLKWVYAYIGG